MTEAGDVNLSNAKTAGEAGEVLSESVSIDRRTTMFKSIGLAVEDVATPQLVRDEHFALHRGERS